MCVGLLLFRRCRRGKDEAEVELTRTSRGASEKKARNRDRQGEAGKNALIEAQTEGRYERAERRDETGRLEYSLRFRRTGWNRKESAKRVLV